MIFYTRLYKLETHSSSDKLHININVSPKTKQTDQTKQIEKLQLKRKLEM